MWGEKRESLFKMELCSINKNETGPCTHTSKNLNLAPSLSNRAHVSSGEANRAERCSRPGLDTGEPEHAGVLPGQRKQ